MTDLHAPEGHTWKQRWMWFESRVSERPGIPEGDLLADLQACFCTGAWLAVLLLCRTVIEAQLRHIRGGDSALEALQVIDADPELRWLRAECEALLDRPLEEQGSPVGPQWSDRAGSECQARRAVEVMCRVFNRVSRWM